LECFISIHLRLPFRARGMAGAATAHTRRTRSNAKRSVQKLTTPMNSFTALVNGAGGRFQGTRSPSSLSLGLNDERREECCSFVHTVHCGQLGDAPPIGIA
jgi:hypothetical protein